MGIKEVRAWTRISWLGDLAKSGRLKKNGSMLDGGQTKWKLPHPTTLTWRCSPAGTVHGVLDFPRRGPFLRANPSRPIPFSRFPSCRPGIRSPFIPMVSPMWKIPGNRVYKIDFRWPHLRSHSSPVSGCRPTDDLFPSTTTSDALMCTCRWGYCGRLQFMAASGRRRGLSGRPRWILPENFAPGLQPPSASAKDGTGTAARRSCSRRLWERVNPNG